MIDGLLTTQIRSDLEMAGMLARYKGAPALFYQVSPQDSDRGWEKPSFPRVDYNLDMLYDPERKAAGHMEFNVWCTSESKFMPEDIEKRILDIVNGTFYTSGEEYTVCAVWNRSDSFNFEAAREAAGRALPAVFGVTVSFDLLQYPPQQTNDPDPVVGLMEWTKAGFPEMKVITHDRIPPIWKPSDEAPAIYWRFEGVAATDRQSYAVNWYNGQFAAHVIAESVQERNGWIKAIIEAIQLDGEVMLPDGSPMLVRQIAVRHGADPLREGQVVLTGQYGVLAQQRKERRQPLLNRAVIAEEPAKNPRMEMEVRAHGE